MQLSVNIYIKVDKRLSPKQIFLQGELAGFLIKNYLDSELGVKSNLCFVVTEDTGFIWQNPCSFWAFLGCSEQLDGSDGWEGRGISEAWRVWRGFANAPEWIWWFIVFPWFFLGGSVAS